MLSLFLAASLAFSPADARISFTAAEGLVTKCTPRDPGTVGAQIAANYILDTASAAGADVRRDRFSAPTPKGERKFTNLYAEFQSDPESPWIVLVSHYDTKPGAACPGANDGASTSGLLVGLANALSAWRTPRGNVMLIWTDGEECFESYSENDGLFGSKRAAQVLKDRKLNVKAVICLDMLGDRDLDVEIPRNGTPALAKLALYAAKKAGMSDKVRLADCIVTDDHVPFLSAGFKAIDLIDFKYGSTPDANDYWHTPADTMDKVSEDSLLAVGRLVVELLNVLLT